MQKSKFFLFLIVLILGLLNFPAQALECSVVDYQKISNSYGNLGARLDSWDYFGVSIANMGDLNGDGITDIAVGATGDADGGSNHGAIWVLFLNSDGTVSSYQKISDTAGNFTGDLDSTDYFGYAMAAIGDLNNDGITDLAVSSRRDDDGGTNVGAVWILFLNPDCTVNHHQKISAIQGNFTGVLNDNDTFGRSLTPLGDFNNDGKIEIAVGAINDDDGGSNRGAVWLLSLNSDGSVNSHKKISSTEGNLIGQLNDGDNFGGGLACLGDVDGDGVVDIAVGSENDDDGGTNRGAVWIIFLNPDSTVKSHQKISSSDGSFMGLLDDGDNFGISIAYLSDLNNDGKIELACTAIKDDDGGIDSGAVWILSLEVISDDIPVYTYCNEGIALELDGVDDYVTVPDNNVVEANEFTISAWANCYGPGGGINMQNPIFSQRDDTSANNHCDISLFADNGFGSASVSIRSSDGSANAVYAPVMTRNEWHHYAATVDSNNLIFYIDALEVGRTNNTQAGNYITSIDYVEIGRNRFMGMDFGYFNGAIDDVMVYDRSLSVEEIEKLYCRQCRVDANLVAHWDFEENSGQWADDRSGNGNHAYLGKIPYGDTSDPIRIIYEPVSYDIFVDDDALADREPNIPDPNFGGPLSDPNEDGSCMNPYDSIQKAINDAYLNFSSQNICRPQIIVSDGIYTGPGNYNIDPCGLAIIIRSENGFENCIIDCNDLGNGFTVHNFEEPNTVIDGFTITDGNSPFFGGAIDCNGTSPTIQNCRLINNQTLWYGGGIF